jgi:hypothetical protein
MSVPGSPVTSSTPNKLLNFFQGFLRDGVEVDGFVGWLSISLISWCPGIGQLGLDHVLLGQPAVAILKTLSLPLFYILILYSSAYLPLWMQGEGLLYLAGLGPWFLFDALQSLMGFFTNYKTGYVSMIDIDFIPLGGAGGKPGGQGGKWKLTASNMNLLFTGLAASMQMIPVFFGEGTRSGANTASYVFLGMLGVSGALSLAATMSASPLIGQATSAVVSTKNPLQSAGGVDPLPPLSEFLNKLPPPTQNGGGKEKMESTLFAQGLGFIALAGITLGLIRSKQ